MLFEATELVLACYSSFRTLICTNRQALHQIPGRDRVIEGVVLTLTWLTLLRQGGQENHQLRPRDIDGGGLGVLGVLEGCTQSWLSSANFGGMDLKGKLVKRGLGKDIRDRGR